MSVEARLLTVLLATALISACGFHLRSYNFESSVDSFAIAGQTRSRIADPLRRGLKQAGIAEAPVDEAALVVEILDQRNERRSVSTAGQARAAEYEVTYGVQYRILGPQGSVLAPPAWVERERIYRIDRENIVGSSEEQALLERELMQDVVSQVIRAMDAVSRNLSAAEGSAAAAP